MWKKKLGNGDLLLVKLIVLSKADDFIPHITYHSKVETYGFNKNALKFKNDYRGVSKPAATSKMELFAIIVNGFHPR